MKNKFLIGITGKKQSGKDTIGKLLISLYLSKTIGILKNTKLEDIYQIVSERSFLYLYKFADPLKDIVTKLINCNRNDLENEIFKNTILPDWNLTPREIMQMFGTDFCRTFNPKIWIKMLDEEIAQSDQDFIIITDVRFYNEVTYIKNMNGIIIKVVDLNQQNSDLHISENELDDFEDYDYIIYNKKESFDVTYSESLKKEVEKIYNDIDSKKLWER